MNKILKVAMIALIGCWLAELTLTAQIKERKISYAKCAYYYGPAEKKDPKGEGKLMINEDYEGNITITGSFDGTNVSNAVVDFAYERITFKGKVYYEKTIVDLVYPYITIYMSEGKLYSGEKLLGEIRNDPFVVTLGCSFGFADIVSSSGKLYTICNYRENIINQAISFAGCDKFEVINHDIIPISLGNTIKFGNSIKSSSPLTLIFENGAKTPLSSSENGMSWTRANGDYITFNYNGNSTQCHLTLKSGSFNYQDNSYTLTHIFPNGNVFEGIVAETLIKSISHEWLTSVREVQWPWEEFCKHAMKGKLTFADGTSFSGEFSKNGFTNADKLDDSAYYKGVMYDSTGAEIDDYQNGYNRAQRDSIERANIAAEQERIAREEAERKAKEEEDRKKKQQLYNKYGKKYVDSILNSQGKKIIVGTPLALLKEFDGKRLLGVLLELRLETDWGDDKCYEWWTANPNNNYLGWDMGYFWTDNGKVSSVSYYD